MIKKSSGRPDRKRLFFVLGLAYFIVLPMAFLPFEARKDMAQVGQVVLPSILLYFVLCGILYKLRHRISYVMTRYDVKRRAKRLPPWLYAHRWHVGIFLWILCTLLQLHGSSIGVYAKIMDVPDLDTAVIGYNRPDRFDEWLNMTPFAFSQYVPGPDGSFSYFNYFLRAVPTDMFIVLGQPCWALGTLFRPFMWGYLFLPPGNGLAFFWMGRLIILALVTFEFGRLLTKDNRQLAALYSLCITLSPGVQWWFGVNAFVETLIAGQGAILVLRFYLINHIKWRQYAYALAFAYLALMYAFVMYPAWQIPFAYLFLAFAIWMVWTYRKEHEWGIGDAFCVFLVSAIVAIVVLHVLQTSADAISLLQSSEYPGKRFISGGDITWDWLFNSGLGLFMPFSGFTNPQYAFNMVQFFDLAPLGIILAVYMMVRQKKADFLLCSFLLINGIFMIFCLVTWPHWLAVATLLFQVPGGRMIIPISFINVLLIIRVFTLWPKPIGWKIALALAVGISAFSAWASFHYCADAYFAHNVAVLLVITFFAVFSICQVRRFLGPFLLGLFLCIGGMINPIARGTACVYDTDLAHEIAAVTAVDVGRWIVVSDDNTLMNNYPPIFGAPTINSYNTYAAWENWNKLDLTDSAKKVVNRCAHFKIKAITEEPSTFSSEHGDLAEITLSRDDVKRLGVSYVMTDFVDLQPLNTDDIQFVPLAWANGFIIYQVTYQEG